MLRNEQLCFVMGAQGFMERAWNTFRGLKENLRTDTAICPQFAVPLQHDTDQLPIMTSGWEWLVRSSI